MNKKSILVIALGFLAWGNLHAQTVVERPQKDGALHEGNVAALSRKQASAGDADLQPVLIKCKDAQGLGESLSFEGYHAVVISDSLLTARVPYADLQKLYDDDRVAYVQFSRQAAPSLIKVRQATGIDKIQSGDGLDTPYTGKGVLIGVIDQGFEFKHIAFLDKNNQSRVVAVWNRKGYSSGSDSKPTTDIPTSGDGFDSYGHATHVTNIAAGSKIKENDYYGMAPDADIVMVPSEFSEAEVLEDVKYISDLAKQRHQPWVINMSFGTQLGAHDGTTDFAHSIDGILADGNGHQIVIAAGNEGAFVEHAEHAFSAKDEMVRLLVNPSNYGAIIDLWGQSVDGEKHLQLRPFIYQAGELDYETPEFWQECIAADQIAPFNNKQHYQLRVLQNMLQGGKLGLEIVGQPGDAFHAWTNSGYGDFMKGPDDTYVAGDNRYCVDEFGSSTRNSVVAAAYVTSNSWTDFKGREEEDWRGDIGDIANFSSVGPSLAGVPKPTVAAPGSVVISAVSKYGTSFDKSSTDNVQIVKRGLKSFYYQQMSGTSMATPATTGVIALWLQANPNLTAQQILEIIQKTSSHDEFTGDEAWNEHWGYGKLNAYEGLKEALRLSDATGITAVRNSETPVSIDKVCGTWRLLFNDQEDYAQVSVVTLDGKVVASQMFHNLERGQEETLSFSHYQPGVYVVTIKTLGSVLTKKLLIQ